MPTNKPRKNECCSPVTPREGADNRAELARVSRIRGQVEGIGRMIEQKSYCPDIIMQIQAARAALAALQGVVLRAHLQHCVKEGLAKGDGHDTEQLLDELAAIFKSS